MSLSTFYEAIHHFAQRIKGSLDLQEDPNNFIHHRRNVIAWIQEETLKLKDQKEKQKKNQNIFTGILALAGVNQANKKLVNSEAALQKIKGIMKKPTISLDDVNIEDLQLPIQVAESLRKLNKAIIPQYYGIVSSPLFKSMYLRSRQDFDNCLKKVRVNNLKFINLGSDSNNVVKYQRVLVQQLFNRLFNHQNELSMIFKIEVEKEILEKSIQIFCYVQDELQKNNRIFKSLNSVGYQQQSLGLQIRNEGIAIKISQMSIFNSFLTQILMVPLQTIVSDYVIQIQRKSAKLLKMHQSISANDLSVYAKQHPSLRNPLFFFYNFIKAHQYSTSSIKQSLVLKQLYSDFYQILNILTEFMKSDFSFRSNNGKMNSLAFNQSTFRVIWKIFHELIVLPNWIEQIITPIKQTITLYEINSKVFPIFNQILKIQKQTYEDYQKSLLNLPIENYLTSNVSKINIEQYKDIFVNSNSIEYVNYNKSNIMDKVFSNTIKNYNLKNVDIYQALYFLNFFAKNHGNMANLGYIHPSWKNKNLWKEIVKLRNNQFESLPYLSINLDILAFQFDFDPIKFSNYPFASIQNDIQNQQLLQRIDILANTLRLRFQKKYNQYLSFLIEKSFKYKKYKLVQYLIKKGVHINNYDQIFVYTNYRSSIRQSKVQRYEQNKKLKELMKNRQPQMFRRYQWQQFINIKLRQKSGDSQVATLQTIKRGKFYVNKDIYSHLTSSNNMNNTISRKDYMFSANRLIAKLKIDETQAYIQITEYPILRYFYDIFLEKIGKKGLALNFCGFFAEKGNLVHLIQCIPQCFNFEKGLSTYSQVDLKNYINQDDVSQAIIISMILMPTNVLLKNIIISRMKYQGNNSQRKSLFIVDFNDFYQKNGFQSNAGNTELKVKNSLFIFDEMLYVISQKVMKKYSNLDIFQIVNIVFKQCSTFIGHINSIKPKNVNLGEQQKQLYTLIFQNGFCEALVERMFKIKLAFEKCLRNKSHIDHLQLLQILNAPLSYYYKQIILSSDKLLQRQKLMLNDNFKKSLIINEKLINFLPNSSYVEEVRDIFPNHYRRFGFQGPTQNLQSLYRNILKFNAYIEKIVDLKQYSHEVIEYLIRNVDLSTYFKEQRQALIAKIQEYSKQYLNKQKNCLPLSVVRISNIETIKEKTLKFSDERLKELIFQDVKCSESQFNSLLKKYHSMKNLILKNVASIQRLGESLISISDTLYLKNLKYLSIIGCNELMNIDIKCDELQHVTLRKNKSLSEIYIFSKRLKNMDCSECTKLRLQNIGIYIFKKINVLICQNSCDGDIKKLEDKSYSVFLTRILRYLFNRFEESNTYKFQLIMTLVKLDLIDQKVFGFKGSQIYSKSLVGIVAKLGTQILSLVQSQIFDLFFKNSLITQLKGDQLLKIQPHSLKVIESYLLKSPTNKVGRKQFSTFRFTQFIRIPQYYVQHLNFVRNIVRYMDVQKTLKLYLKFSPQIAVADYIQMINILNNKENLQKIDLTVEKSYINADIILFLFSLDAQKNKIGKIQFIECEIKVQKDFVISTHNFVKDLIFRRCTVDSLQFIRFFQNIVSLQINECKFGQQLSAVYWILSQFKSLTSLSLIKLKENHQQALFLDRLFITLQTLLKFKQLNFSSNSLNRQQLVYFSDKISKVKIYELKLYDFYHQGTNEYIDAFLQHKDIKIISIQFKTKHNKLIQSFIDSLSKNKSVLRVNLKTDHQIQSGFFQKMKLNEVVENFNSNQPIPNWLKNHINNNKTKGKSVIYEYESFEPYINSANKKEDFYRIGLSLDGGGVRGLLLATELDYLSRKVGRPLHKIFDCVGGTSIGGILALASTGSHDGHSPICSTSDLIDIFEKYGNRIFKKSQFGAIVNLFQNKYDVKSFEQLISGYFKQTKLSDVLSQTNVVVTAVNRLTNEDVIFRSINAIFDRNQDFYMKDIARGTSAAPTYFPSAEIKNINANMKYSLIDGGVGLNNPSKLVIDDIIKSTQNEAYNKNYFLLSLGTGRLINEAIPSNAGIKDLAPIIDSFTESANFFIEKDLSQNYKGHYLRVSPLIDLHRKDGQLDNTSPQILKVYKSAGERAAQEYFSNTIAFGKYKNQSLVEWLRENTDRKYQA